jgi:hypothetical protein
VFSEFVSILYDVFLPIPSRLLSCISITPDPRAQPRRYQLGSVAFHPLRSHNNHLKPICSNSYMPLFHFFLSMSFCCVAALAIPCPPSRPLSQTARTSFRLALFLDNIRAPKHPSSPKPHHCILIARHFVSRRLSFYVLYYLARLDSGRHRGNQCTFHILQLDCAPCTPVPE